MKKRILNIGLVAVLVLLSSVSMYAQGRDNNNHNGNYNNTSYNRQGQESQNFARGDRDHNGYRGGDRDDHRFDRREEYRGDRGYRRDYNYNQRYWVAPHYEMRGCYRVWIDGYWAF